MKRICQLLMICLLQGVLVARGQESPAAAAARQEMEESIKVLKGQVDDLKEANSTHIIKIKELEKQISDLREQASKPTGNFANAEDVKRLAEAIQEIDKKRESDKEFISKQIAELGKTFVAPPPPTTHVPIRSDPSADAGPKADQPGFNYVIKKGDSISLIAQAYRDQGVKVYSDAILKANPGLNPDKLRVGQKVFIPAPKTDK